MISSVSDDTTSSKPDDSLFTIEYSLSVADFHALDMYQFDRTIRNRMGFQLRFFGGSVLQGVFISLCCGYLGWSTVMYLSSGSFAWNALLPLIIGCISAAIPFLFVLIGLLPGSYYHWYNRRQNEKRFWRNRERLVRIGLQKFKQNCRVTLTSDGFTEALQSCEASEAIEITESKITKVRWAAVSRIEVEGNYAFFTVEGATLSFSNQGFLVLPRFAFDSESRFHAFIEAAQKLRAEADKWSSVTNKQLTLSDSRIRK